MEEVKRSVRLNTAAFEAFKNMQKILNDFVRLNMYNKIFIDVARNISVTVLGNTVEFEVVISSSNIKILKKKDKDVLAFSNKGYCRLTILFYSSINLNLTALIKLLGNSLTKLIEQTSHISKIYK